MSDYVNNQVHLIGDFRREEAYAAATIKPGMLVEETSAGTFQAHSVSGGYAVLLVAEIDALQGGVLGDSYTVGKLVSANVELPGNEVQMFLKKNENVAIGAKLMSGGDGTLVAVSGTEKQAIAVAREAKDLTDSLDVDTLIRVMLL